MIDKGSPGGGHAHAFITMVVIMVYHICNESYKFSLLSDI